MKHFGTIHRYRLIILLSLIVAMATTCRSYQSGIRYQPKGCKSGRIIYATDDYGEYKKAYAQMFDSVAKGRVAQCLCGKFKRHFRTDRYSVMVIEPLYVSLQHCTGVYAKRFFFHNHPHFRDGHPHDVFLIDGNRYREVPEDTLKLRKLLLHPTSNFAKVYSKEVLEGIYRDIKYGRIWTKGASILGPYHIKNNGITIYNAYKE